MSPYVLAGKAVYFYQNSTAQHKSTIMLKERSLFNLAIL